MPPPDSPLQPEAVKTHPFFGKTIARCQVGEAIGRGRTSWVCRAHYEPLDREIALKILSGDPAEEGELKEQFLGEARAIAQLDHENIVKVLDVVEDQGHLCILMEYVAGDTLQQRLRAAEGPLPVRKALRIALQTARALEAAHADKVIHRDVKPANVLLAPPAEQVKVVDFGLAGPKTLANRAGTPLYMSPEACQGRRIDEKSDVYALGVCLYQMLTGELPFTGKSVKEILAKHVKGECRPPSDVDPQLGKDYDDIVKKLMVASKGYRPSAAEAVALLEPLVEQSRPGKQQARGGGGRRTRTRRTEKKKAPPTVAILGIVGLVLAAIVAFLLLRDDDKQQTSQERPDTPLDAPPGAVTAGGTGGTGQGTGATTTPATPASDPAQDAFDDVLTWSRENPDDFAGAAQRWDEMAAQHAGTKWSEKAQSNAESARQDLKREEELAQLRKEREEADARIAKQHEELAKLIALYDFSRAASMAGGMTNAPGQEVKAFRKQKARLWYLGEEFRKRLDEGAQSMQIPATVVKADAGHDEIVVGSGQDGIQTRAGDLPRKVLWKTIKPEQMFALFKKFTSQSKVENNVFLAVLATEVGLDRPARDFREVALLIDQHGTAKDRLREFFLDDVR